MTEHSQQIPTQQLTAWLRAAGLLGAEDLHLSPLVGGRSHIMARITRPHAWVVRRPARVAAPGATRGLEREYRILSALQDTVVPAPRPIALCLDEQILGAPFYVMSDEVGFNPMPDELHNDPAAATDALLAMVDALVTLHSVDWRAVGLADFGRPDGFHERQVARWSGQLASYQGRTLPGLTDVGSWLQAHPPTRAEASIMHGDYHMRNVLVHGTPLRVSAILDWETATIGDPLLDIAGLVEIWRATFPQAQPWPTDTVALQRYAVASQRDLADLQYYRVLYNFRLAVLLEGIYQRSLRDTSRVPDDSTGHLADRAVRRAVELIS